jgi:import inner membrane translocase subunit TIM9
MNAIQQLPQHQQQDLQRQIEEMSLKDSLLMYNNVVEKCFNECVTGFRSKMVSGDMSRNPCVKTDAVRCEERSGEGGA